MIRCECGCEFIPQVEYYHWIICGDCREAETWCKLLDAAQVEKVNGVFTSPPYAEQRKAQYGGIPVGEYVAWWEAVQANVKANLADDGSFFVNIKPHTQDGERALYTLDLVLAMKRRWDWHFIDELIWYKTGFPGAYKNRFMNEFEPVYWFTAGGYSAYLSAIDFNDSELPIINESESIFHFGKATKVKFNPKACGHISDGVNQYVGGRSYNPLSGNIAIVENRQRGWARPGNVIKVHVNTERLAQAAVFPIGLPTFFVKSFSDSGGIWLDPFLGSGTAIIAAHNNGRRGLGIELLPKYVSVALERLAQIGLPVERL